MDSAPTIVSATNSGPLSDSPASISAKAATTHPLILAAVLVWMSVDLIGDGLVALRNVLASVTSERTATPS